MKNGDLKRFYPVNPNEDTRNGFVRYDENGDLPGGGAAGTVPTVIITDQYATLTDDEYNTLLNNKLSAIYFNDVTYIKNIKDSSSQEMKFYSFNINQNGFLFMNRISVYSNKSISIITGGSSRINLTSMYSGSATKGQVPTANGSGGITWQNVGASSQLYLHCLRLTQSASSTVAGYTIYANIISSSNTQIAGYNLRDALYSMVGSKNIIASGVYIANSSGTQRDVLAIYPSSSSSLNVHLKATSGATIETITGLNISSVDVVDQIITL